MKPEDSLFSCIKRGESGEEGLHLPANPSPPPAAPPPAPRQPDRLEAQVAELEAKVRKLECLSADVPGQKTDELGKALEEVRGAVLEGRQESQAVKDEFFRRVERLATEISAVCLRLAAVEEAGKGLFAKSPEIFGGGEFIERRLKIVEAEIAAELGRRFSSFDAALADASRKAGLAIETAGGTARRADSLEERVSRLAYLESRLHSIEAKLERVNECDALVQALRVSVESMERNVNAVRHETAGISGEQTKICSDFEALSRQVKQLGALFNYFRGELAFLVPAKKETGAD